MIGMEKEILGVPKRKNKAPEYMNFSLVDYDKDELKADLEKWMTNDKYFKAYKNVNIHKPNFILVRLYRFEKLTDFLATPILQTKILPYAKVIKGSVSGTNYQPGTILSCPESIEEIATNPTWLQWNKIMTDSRPVPEGLPEPEKTTGLILEWRKNYQFTLDKLNPTLDDKYTFILPESMFNAEYLAP